MDTQQPEQNSVISYEQPAPQPLPQPPGRSFSVSKKLIVIIGIALLLIFVVAAFLLLSKKGHPVTTAQFQDTLLATVGDQKIHKSDVITAAGEQYTPSAITSDVLKKYLDIVIERTILDQEAKKLGITITDAEIQKSIVNNKTKSPGLISIAKYQLIKNALIQKQVKSVQAYLIGYWIPPYNYQQVPLFAQERTVGKQALEEGKTLLQNGMPPLTVAQTLFEKYPLLDPIWSINGYFVNKLKDTSLVQSPRTLTVGETDIDASIFALKKGDIAIVDGPNGAGASLVQIVSLNSGDFTTYESWLAEKKKTLVTTENAL